MFRFKGDGFWHKKLADDAIRVDERSANVERLLATEIVHFELEQMAQILVGGRPNTHFINVVTVEIQK